MTSGNAFLLDEGAIVGHAYYPLEAQNLAAALFQLEHARDEATRLQLYQRLVEVLDSAALDSLKRAFGRWIYKSYVLKKRPGIELPDINDFHEVHAVLQKRVEEWNRQLLEQGRKQGREETQRETADNLIRTTALDDAAIARATGLSEADVQALRQASASH